MLGWLAGLFGLGNPRPRNRRWYRGAVRQTPPAAALIPGPQMTDDELATATQPTGTAAPLLRAAYIGVWLAQLAAVIVGLIITAQFLLGVLARGEAVRQACMTGDQTGCVAPTAADGTGAALGIAVCLVVLIAGRPARQWLLGPLRRSALADARRRRRALQDRMVLVADLPARSQTLLDRAEQDVQNLPQGDSDALLWDLARRLDAAAVLDDAGEAANRADPQAADELWAMSDWLVEQATSDARALARAAATGYRVLRPLPQTGNPRTVPRSTDPAVLVHDAGLLLPRAVLDEHRPQKEQTR